MQTFLPYADFNQSAAVLDNRRLGKQRVETLQIMKALLGIGGWQNHPAVKMWRGYELSLMDYQHAITHEWSVVRGYRDTCRAKTLDLLLQFDIDLSVDDPPWLGDEAFHQSHRSNLLRKDPSHYGPLFPNEPDHLEYIWPIKEMQ